MQPTKAREKYCTARLYLLGLQGCQRSTALFMSDEQDFLGFFKTFLTLIAEQLLPL